MGSLQQLFVAETVFIETLDPAVKEKYKLSL